MIPGAVIAVGVTGHRHPRLPVAAVPAVDRRIRHCLAAIRAAVLAITGRDDTLYAPVEPRFRLVTSLAEGSDTIAADAAFEAGWEINACLPFDAATYAADFTGDTRARFDAARARCTVELALPGSRTDSTAAYEAAGRIMLDQSDIVLAIWDGDPALGRGGTAQIVAEAVAEHVPVVLIATDDTPPQILWSGLDEAAHDEPTIEGVPRADFDRDVARLVHMLMAPPSHPHDRRMILHWQAEGDRKRTPAIGYPLLLAATGARRLSRRDFVPATAADCAAPFVDWLGGLPGDAAFRTRLSRYLSLRFGRADAAATYFAQLFRTGFVTNFLFAAMAVLFALTGLVLPKGKLVFVMAELTVIAVILVNTRGARKRGWHERWMDNRHLAERLRLTALSAILADLALRADDHDVGAVPGWVRWLSRASARQVGLPSGAIDADYLARARASTITLIDDQIGYNRANAERMHRLDHRLHQFGEALFALTILACGGWIILYLLGSPWIAGHGVGATQWVTLLTAFLPALGAAIYGIRMQGDFHGMAERSKTTVRLLSALKRAMAKDRDDLDLLRSRVKRLADIMLMDIAHWRTTYQARPLHLPG